MLRASAVNYGNESAAVTFDPQRRERTQPRSITRRLPWSRHEGLLRRHPGGHPVGRGAPGGFWCAAHHGGFAFRSAVRKKLAPPVASRTTILPPLYRRFKKWRAWW